MITCDNLCGSLIDEYGAEIGGRTRFIRSPCLLWVPAGRGGWGEVQPLSHPQSPAVTRCRPPPQAAAGHSRRRLKACARAEFGHFTAAGTQHTPRQHDLRHTPLPALCSLCCADDEHHHGQRSAGGPCALGGGAAS